jgi:hypothetical protein
MCVGPGLLVHPLRQQSKNPGRGGWHGERTTDDELPDHRLQPLARCGGLEDGQPVLPIDLVEYVVVDLQFHWPRLSQQGDADVTPMSAGVQREFRDVADRFQATVQEHTHRNAERGILRTTQGALEPAHDADAVASYAS